MFIACRRNLHISFFFRIFVSNFKFNIMNKIKSKTLYLSEEQTKFYVDKFSKRFFIVVYKVNWEGEARWEMYKASEADWDTGNLGTCYADGRINIIKNYADCHNFQKFIDSVDEDRKDWARSGYTMGVMEKNAVECYLTNVIEDRRISVEYYTEFRR